MGRRIEVLPKADQDLDDHFAYIAADHFDAAVRFLHAARDAFRKLSDMPGMGPATNFEHLSLQSLRFWPIRGFENFLVFYRDEGDQIAIVRVIHGARNLERALLR
jgi:toxin ParE1/3/4